MKQPAAGTVNNVFTVKVADKNATINADGTAAQALVLSGDLKDFFWLVRYNPLSYKGFQLYLQVVLSAYDPFNDRTTFEVAARNVDPAPLVLSDDLILDCMMIPAD